MSHRARIVIGIITVALAAAFALGLLPIHQAPAEAPATTAQVAVRAGDSAVFSKLLNSLTVAGEKNAGYDRDRFTHWTTQPSGCDTREVVLAQEATRGTVRGCTVKNGTWSSWYDGKTVTRARSLDIDHMVPLAEAWGSGARSWPANRREAYANDLGYPESLQAVTAASNRSKSDRDPAEWQPPRAAATCRYAQAWVAVKWRWQLTVDPAEKKALAQGLRTCTKRLVPVPTRAR